MLKLVATRNVLLVVQLTCKTEEWIYYWQRVYKHLACFCQPDIGHLIFFVVLRRALPLGIPHFSFTIRRKGCLKEVVHIRRAMLQLILCHVIKNKQLPSSICLSLIMSH